jgi:hypothetical protein
MGVWNIIEMVEGGGEIFCYSDNSEDARRIQENILIVADCF